MSNYASHAVDALNEHPDTAGNPPELQGLYALLVLTRGTAVTAEDVHDAWAMWRRTTRLDHPDLVPFAQLSPEAQAKDEPYRDAIADVARQLGSATGRPAVAAAADMDDLAECFVPTLDGLISSVIRDEELPAVRNTAALRCASIAWHEGARRG